MYKTIIRYEYLFKHDGIIINKVAVYIVVEYISCRASKFPLYDVMSDGMHCDIGHVIFIVFTQWRYLYSVVVWIRIARVMLLEWHLDRGSLNSATYLSVTWNSIKG